MKTREQIINEVCSGLTQERIRDLIAFTLDTSAALINAGCPDNVAIPAFIREHIAPDPPLIDRVTNAVEAWVNAGAGTRDELAEIIEHELVQGRPVH